MLLDVRHLTKHYCRHGASFTAVKDISFSLSGSDMLVIAGESGSGKSTLCRLICQFSRADAGTICLNGTDITHVPPNKQKELYRHIQMVFQYPYRSFHPRYTLRTSILAGVRNYHLSLADDRLQALLAEVRLNQSLLDRYPHQVSGGECQRAALLRALLLEPELLICDEVTSALDVTFRTDIAALIRSVCQRHHIACLFVTHDLYLARTLADQIIVMHQGQIVERGTPEAIFTHPQNDYTKALLAAMI